MPNNAPGEGQIIDADIQQHSSDLIQKRGQLALDLGVIHKMKPVFDQVIAQIAKESGATFYSRAKNPESIVKKITSKRMEGRSYNLPDINDSYGARIIIQDESQEKQVKKAILQAALQHKFEVLEVTDQDDGDAPALHIDIAFPIAPGKAVRGEIQVLTRESDAKMSITHDAHYRFGENPPKKIKAKLDKQGDEIGEMPPIKQDAVANTMLKAHKANEDKPLPDDFSRKVIDQVKKH